MLLVGGSHDARGRGGRRAVRTAHRRRFGRIARRGRPAVCAFSTGAGLSDSTRLRRHPVTGSSCFARVRLAATGTSARHLVQMYQSRPKWADIHLTNEVQGAQRASAEHARAPAGLGWEARTPQRGSAGKPGRNDCRTARGEESRVNSLASGGRPSRSTCPTTGATTPTAWEATMTVLAPLETTLDRLPSGP